MTDKTRKRNIAILFSFGYLTILLMTGIFGYFGGIQGFVGGGWTGFLVGVIGGIAYAFVFTISGFFIYRIMGMLFREKRW